jgi:hypothetical protein
MTTHRFCTFYRAPCACDGVGIMPCLAALIETYLAALGSSYQCPFILQFCDRDIVDLFVRYATWLDLKNALEGPGHDIA